MTHHMTVFLGSLKLVKRVVKGVRHSGLKLRVMSESKKKKQKI